MDIFVYGTLRDPDLMRAVAGPGPLDPIDATLPGYQVWPLADHVVPFIAPGQGHAKGVLWTGLSDQQRARLDLYEDAFGYTLTPVEVVAAGKPRIAQVYMPPPGCKAGPGDWFLTDWQRKCGPASVNAATEIFAHDPLPDAEGLAQMWRMTQMRGWAKYRASQHNAPATRRSGPTVNDFKITHADPPMGEFFRMRAIDVTHTRFDGTTAGPLRREVFVGVDASLVLPYDPVTDRVLLVEQCRMGAMLRGDPNPWVLEPIAGMVDPMESPQDAALRETAEEAGITQITLEKINEFYPSPGSSTDYFHAYLGICELGNDASYSGGLATEAEDLRLHPMSFDDAMALAASGEITAGPLMMMLYWLGLNRDRLRAAAA